MSEKVQSIILKLISVYLIWFTAVFLLAVLGNNISFLQEGTTLGDLLIRRPYQFAEELMFTVFFLVWGIFLWKSTINIHRNKFFIGFTAVGLLTHGIVFVILGIISKTQSTHFFLVSIWWFVAGGLALWVWFRNKNESKTP